MHDYQLIALLAWLALCRDETPRGFGLVVDVEGPHRLQLAAAFVDDARQRYAVTDETEQPDA